MSGGVGDADGYRAFMGTSSILKRRDGVKRCSVRRDGYRMWIWGFY